MYFSTLWADSSHTCSSSYLEECTKPQLGHWFKLILDLLATLNLLSTARLVDNFIYISKLCGGCGEMILTQDDDDDYYFFIWKSSMHDPFIYMFLPTQGYGSLLDPVPTAFRQNTDVHSGQGLEIIIIIKKDNN